MKESDLYLPVRDWLRTRGYTVHIEMFGCDVVGIKGDHIVAVELKAGMHDRLYGQLTDRARWADEVWGAVPSTAAKPKSGWDYHGFGLLHIAGGKLRVKRKARPQPWAFHRMQQYRLKVLGKRHPARDCDVAGLPCCKQMREQRNVSRTPIAAGAIS